MSQVLEDTTLRSRHTPFFSNHIMADEPLSSSPMTMQHSQYDANFSTCFYKRIVWLLCATLSLLSARYLLVESNIHYPLQLYFSQLAVTGLVALLPWQGTKGLGHERSKPQRAMAWGTMYSTASICFMALSTICALQAILHFNNLPTLVMITAIAYFAENLLLLVFRIIPYKRAEILRTCGLVSASIGLLYTDHRLSVPGLVASILAMLFAGAARALWKVANIQSPEAGAANMRHTGRFVIIGALVGVMWVLVFRTTHEIFAIDFASLPLLAFNALTSALALTMGRSIMFPMDFEVADTFAWTDDTSVRQNLDALTLLLYTGTVGCLSTLLTRRSYTNLYQICCCWVVASWCIASRSPLATHNAQPSAHSTYELLDVAVPSTEDRSTSGLTEGNPHTEMLANSRKAGTLLKLLLAGVGVVLWLAYAYLNYFLPSEPRSPALLDLSYTPQPSVEIVISMYKESPNEVGKVIQNLKSNPALSDAHTIIYIKDSEADNNDIKQQTGADRVTSIPNIGREGETYLNHIINKWDNLANQTIFLQADIHNPREFYTHLNYYYSRPKTGFLNLGWSGAVCNCQNCGDKLSWQDNTHFLPQIYTQIHNSTDCNHILLSYKGQFIVSAARIRGIDKKIYQSLWETFT
ncbi:hypothetical protein GQ44DRAFT_707671, partial [Phaeosphaeriaceae sp. PMI808]